MLYFCCCSFVVVVFFFVVPYALPLLRLMLVLFMLESIFYQNSISTIYQFFFSLLFRFEKTQQAT